MVNVMWATSSVSPLSLSVFLLRVPRENSASKGVGSSGVSQEGPQGVTHPLPVSRSVGQMVAVSSVTRLPVHRSANTKSPTSASIRATLAAYAATSADIYTHTRVHLPCWASPPEHIMHPPSVIYPVTAARQVLLRCAWANPRQGLAAPLPPGRSHRRMKWLGSRSIAMSATTANAPTHVECCLAHKVSMSATVASVTSLLLWRVPCATVPDCMPSNLLLPTISRSPSIHPRAIPPPHPQSLHLLSAGSSCVALVHLVGTRKSTAAATHGALLANAAEAVDVHAKLVANAISGTPTPPPDIGPAASSDVDVAAEIVQAAVDATPTSPPSESARVEAVDVVAKLDARHISATPTASRPPQAPGASSLLRPPHPPSSPVGDEARAQAEQQSTAETTRAGSLASCFRSVVSAHPIVHRVRRVERNVARTAEVVPRPSSATVLKEDCVPVRSVAGVPAEKHVAAATAAGGVAVRAADDAPPALPEGLGGKGARRETESMVAVAPAGPDAMSTKTRRMMKKPSVSVTQRCTLLAARPSKQKAASASTMGVEKRHEGAGVTRMRRLSDLGAWPSTRTRMKVGAAGREVIIVPAAVPDAERGRSRNATAAPPTAHVEAHIGANNATSATMHAIASLTQAPTARGTASTLTRIHRHHPNRHPPIFGAPWG